MGERRRILLIDVLRGISIFGIFIVNIYAFSMPSIYIDPYSEAETALDKTIYLLTDVFAQGSFYPLFSFLFGYSFILLLEKLEEKGLNANKVLFRRMAALLLIGFVHIVFFWSGDILVTYAVAGFLLLLVKNWGEKKLAIVALLLYAIPNLLYIPFIPFMESGSNMNQMIDADEVERIYQNGRFMDITRFRIEEWWTFNGLPGLFIIVFMIFPLFLIGMAFARGRKLEKNPVNERFFRKLFLVAFPIGLFLKFLPYLNSNILNELIKYFFGGPILTFAYISLFYFLVNGSRGKNIWNYFANVGKMSLTNYLFQSVISTFLFYSYGFGLYGKLTYYEITFIVFIIFLFQIFLSNYWFKFYRQGPMEWIWRGLTYGRFSKLKKKESNFTKNGPIKM